MIYKTLHRKLKVEQHELMCSGKISSSCSISGIRRATRVTNPMVMNVITTSEKYPWSFVTQIFRYGGDRKTFEVMTLT
jgi:hypothetical protein